MLFDSVLEKIQEQNVSSSASQIITEQVFADLLSNDELTEMCSSPTDCNFLVEENEICTEKTIVRLDKKAKLSRAFKAAVFTIAREKNDPKFRKLLTIWRMERTLENYLNKKYRSEALKRARLSLTKVANTNKNKNVSKTKIVQKAAAKAKKQLNSK